MCLDKAYKVYKSIKPCSRTSFDSQHVKGSKTHVISAWQNFRHIFSLLVEKLSWKMSLSVICEIFGRLVDTLTADDSTSFVIVRFCSNEFKYNYLKNGTVFFQFRSTSKIFTNFWRFWKKRWPSYLIYFQNYVVRNTWLDKCLKSQVSEHP